ncbi:hypothetical protein ASPTUDRAFT_28763 [Aspergillus tubingensis CBS 134.48]|uniref:stearoyl-CoA 9-desaturase n=1 Tax=Aspergillus tubingensis (strain CBS 134.48) TaxID=767770 RepID=A0A1L9N6Y9_ASPTC|nr:hypothetical protein ASPTUDRAFT_28763 [Aspergillus tubingensis CBS 134.48]
MEAHKLQPLSEQRVHISQLPMTWRNCSSSLRLRPGILDTSSERNSNMDLASLQHFLPWAKGINFHHSFPSDYRNAEKWWQYDPTKWIIWIWGQLGLAYDLKTFADNEILKCRLQQRQRLLDHEKLQLDWGFPIESLPVIQWRDYIYQIEVSKRPLIVISGIVHDVSRFIDTHPGGRTMIQSGIGKDATSMFKGGVYMHSKSAHNQLAKMRVAVIYGGGEVAEYQRQEE